MGFLHRSCLHVLALPRHGFHQSLSLRARTVHAAQIALVGTRGLRGEEGVTSVDLGPKLQPS